jgi:AcrR family transcriptional regulator
MKTNTVTKNSNVPTGYRAKARASLHELLLEIASRLLAEGGLEALSMRRIAEEAQASTSVIYTIFGGKTGLLEELWVEGFSRLWQAESLAFTETCPIEKIRALGKAYRANALANPNYFRIIFAGPIKRTDLSPSAQATGLRTYQALIDAAQEAIDQGLALPIGGQNLAASLWSSVHGFVTLELSGYFGNREQSERLFEMHIDATINGVSLKSRKKVL